MTDNQPGGWTPRAYTDFALSSQLPAMWTLATWIRHTAAAAGVPAVTAALDAGAGPALLSRLVAAQTGAPVTAAVQPGFAGIAEDLKVPGGSAGTVTVCPLAALSQGSSIYPLVYSYGCLHELADKAGFLRDLRHRTEPGGVLLVIDTIRDAGQAVGAGLGGVGRVHAAAISDTFARSLSLAEFTALASSALPGAVVAPLEFGGEVLLDAELSMPETFPDDPVLYVPVAVLAAIQWRHQPATAASSRTRWLADAVPHHQPEIGGEKR